MKVRIELKRPTKGKGLAAAVQKAVAAATREEADEVQDELEGTTRTWKRQPRFGIKRGQRETIISTADAVYGYVDAGTKPHLILPKKRMLVFNAGGTPKTQPGVLTPGSGSKGTTPVFVRAVHHPGTKARNFTKIIARRSRGRYPTRVQDAIKRGIA